MFPRGMLAYLAHSGDAWSSDAYMRGLTPHLQFSDWTSWSLWFRNSRTILIYWASLPTRFCSTTVPWLRFKAFHHMKPQGSEVTALVQTGLKIFLLSTVGSRSTVRRSTGNRTRNKKTQTIRSLCGPTPLNIPFMARNNAFAVNRYHKFLQCNWRPD